MAGTISKVIVTSGPQEGRSGVLAPYNGLWCKVIFDDKKKPKESYMPRKAVKVVKE